MCRGVFAVTSLIIFSLAISSLFSIYSQIRSNFLNYTSTILNGEEAFYRARNFETSFRFAVANGRINEWFTYWKPVYGFYDDINGRCVQVNDSFEKFLNKTLKIYGGRAVLEPYQKAPSCLSKEIIYKGFKTRGMIRSTLCINLSSPLFLCSQ